MRSATIRVWWSSALLAAACARSGTQPPPAEPPPAESPLVMTAQVTPSPPPATPPVTTKASAITRAGYGKVAGSDVELYTLINANGLVLKVMTYGAIITELHVPDRTGKLADVVVGFET